ncbi:MAG: GIY-YIG nuclease family protein [Pseudomonadota bacterium]
MISEENHNYKGRTIRLFLVDGKIGGIITAEIMNWTGHVLMGPRSRLGDIFKREETSKTGVYFLINQDDEESKVYIGESDVVQDRLRNHASKKDFWTTVCFVTSKDDNLTKTHVRYLESRLLQLAKDAGRYEIDNEKAPDTPKIPESDLHDMEDFLTQVQIILPTLGLDVLRPSQAEITKQSGSSGNEQASLQHIIFQLKIVKHGIDATMIEKDGEFIVVKGSRGRAWMGGPDPISKSKAGKERSQALIDQKKVKVQPGDMLLFMQDVPFKSPSAASSVVTGRSSNGRTEWRVRGSKKTYAEWQDSQIDNAEI